MTRRITAALVAAVILLSASRPAFADHQSFPSEASPVDLQELVDAADPGDVLRLEPGTYRGGVVIDKPITIEGEGWPVVDGDGEGSVMEVDADDVTITGLVIRGSGDNLDKGDAGVTGTDPQHLRVEGNRFEEVLFGIYLDGADDAVIADNVIGGLDLFIARRGDAIRLWESHRALVEGNIVDQGRDNVFWYSDDVTIRDNRMTGSRYGLHFMYSNGAVIERNVLARNSVGAFLMYSSEVEVRENVFDTNRGPSGNGLGLKDVDGLLVEGNRFVGNQAGVFIDNSPTKVDETHVFQENVFAFNDVGMLLQPSVRNNIFRKNVFIDNGEHVALDGSGALKGNEWSSGGVGNYWSDYAGYDADRDGVGDIAYDVDALFSSLTDDHPSLMIFNGTPASRAVDMAGRAFPNLRPDPTLTDPAPLVAIPELPAMPGANDATSSRGALALVSLALLGLAGLVIWPSRRLVRS